MTERYEDLGGRRSERQPPVKILRPPVKHCPDCAGTGWIESIEERLPVHRCECMTREDDDADPS